ncbi:MAG: carbamate kinase [Candidatus Brocadiales bacterium]|nr:carbamate kinase [Candidatus Brocadiales bacterium]
MGVKKAVIAFGGNAILKEKERGTVSEQLQHCRETCDALLDILDKGYELIIVHGNGPQVGNMLIQMEEAGGKTPSLPLDVCVAATQGTMGFMLEIEMRNQLRERGIEREVTTLVTQVVIDPDIEKFEHPTKPVGPFYSAQRAEELRQEKHWEIVEDSHRGFRRVVPSPRPVQILGIQTIKSLVERGHIIIAGGGGGIPLLREEGGRMVGVEAVVDKDYTASLLAREVEAELFIILTRVPGVAIGFRTERERFLDRLTVQEARKYLASGEFPPGSMGPKVSAALDFVEATGQEVLITAPEVLKQALEGLTGTRLVKDDVPSVKLM